MTLKERDQRILDYLRIRRSNFGEVYTFELGIPQAELDTPLPPKQNKIIRETLLRFQGNPFPIVARPTEDYGPYERYEVLFGYEICRVAKELVLELGEQQARELHIDRLKVWLIEFEDPNELSQIQHSLDELMHNLYQAHRKKAK